MKKSGFRYLLLFLFGCSAVAATAQNTVDSARKARDRAMQELSKAEDDIQTKQAVPKRKPMKSVEEALSASSTEETNDTKSVATDSATTAAPKAEPVKAEPAKPQDKKASTKAKDDNVKAEPAKTTDARKKPAKVEAAKEAPPKVAPSKSEKNKVAPAKAEKVKAGKVKPVVEPVPMDGDLVVGIDVKGDGALLDKTGLRRKLEAATIGRRFTKERAEALAAEYGRMLYDAGYVFADMKAVWPLKDSRLSFTLDQGRFGKTTIFQRGVKGKKPYAGRYFKEKQIENKLDRLTEGEAFDYAKLYNSVYRINAHPDLAADVDLKPRTIKSGDTEQRVVDMDFSVEDNLPLHAMIELSNEGTDVTDEWEAGLTLQHLNLTGHDDILTLSAPFSLDFESIRSVSAGYYLPYNWRNGGNISVFGGYSQLNSKSVIDEIGLEGDGWFAGIQSTYYFIDNDDYALNGSFGISHSVVKDNLVFQDQPQLDREVSLTPLLLMVSYYDVRPDRWDGLNAASLSATIHSSSFPGASDDEEFEAQRENAKADYMIGRLNLSRLQPVFASTENPEHAWTFFSKLEAQYASEPLIPSEQKGAGGYDTVRGYIEREFLGDDGANATLELRTPLHRSSVFPRWFKKYREENPAFETVQGLVFADGAYTSLKDALAGESKSDSIASIGLGVRLAIGSNMQLRADWGFPLVETEDSSTTGRGHISLQLIF